MTFDAARVTPYNGPTAASTKIKAGTSRTVQVAVTNTSGVGRTYTLSTPNKDLRATPTYIPAGATVLVPAVLTPTASAGRTVTGSITVGVNYSDLTDSLAGDGFVFDDQSVATIPYGYTVS